MEDEVGAKIVGRATMQERYTFMTTFFLRIIPIHCCAAAEIYVSERRLTLSSLGSSTSFLTSPAI